MSPERIYEKNRQALVDEMMEMYGYLFCQKCEQSECGSKFEVHHLVFRSEEPKHPELHSKKNLIIVGDWCHKEGPNSFHKKKSERNRFIKARGLDKIFTNLWGYFDEI